MFRYVLHAISNIYSFQHYKKNILKTIRQNDHSQRTHYKNILFIFNNKPYVKIIIPATNDHKKKNKLHYYYFYFTPNIYQQIKKLFTIPLLYRHTTQTLSFHKTYIYTLTADISLYIARATDPLQQNIHTPHPTPPQQTNL